MKKYKEFWLNYGSYETEILDDEWVDKHARKDFREDNPYTHVIEYKAYTSMRSEFVANDIEWGRKFKSIDDENDKLRAENAEFKKRINDLEADLNGFINGSV